MYKQTKEERNIEEVVREGRLALEAGTSINRDTVEH